VWQIKDLEDEISDVWQIKELTELAGKAEGWLGAEKAEIPSPSLTLLGE